MSGVGTCCSCGIASMLLLVGKVPLAPAPLHEKDLVVRA